MAVSPVTNPPRQTLDEHLNELLEAVAEAAARGARRHGVEGACCMALLGEAPVALLWTLSASVSH